MPTGVLAVRCQCGPRPGLWNRLAGTLPVRKAVSSWASTIGVWSAGHSIACYDRSVEISAEKLSPYDPSLEIPSKIVKPLQPVVALRSQRGNLATKYDPNVAKPPKNLRPEFGRFYDVKKVRNTRVQTSPHCITAPPFSSAGPKYALKAFSITSRLRPSCSLISPKPFLVTRTPTMSLATHVRIYSLISFALNILAQ